MKIHPILAVAAWLVSLPAFAQHNYVPNYTYIEGGYARADTDALGSLDGAAFRGSANFGNFNFVAGMTRFNVDNNPFIDHVRATFAGFGYHVPIAKAADLFAEATYNRYNPIDQDGYAARIGVRARFDPRWEGSAALAYAKVDNVESSTAIDLQLQFFLTEKLGVVGGAALGSDEKTYTVGLRFTP